MSRNASRQCHTRSSISSGTVTVMAPSIPAAKAKPLRVEILSAGYQSANAVSEAMSPAETPSPMRARATTAAPAESACANHAPPAAATSSRVALTRRGPKRSSRIPSGSWNKPKARK